MTPPPHPPGESPRDEANAAVAALARRAEDALRPLVRRGERCALVGFPDYANVGDSAIWLGERALLDRLGASLAYVSDERNFDPAELRRRVGDGPVFLQGGGNLGDLWPHHQAFREAVIQALPGSPVVQLPQSIHFRDARNLARARRVLSGHERLTILARDPRSLEIASAELPSARTLLCPDMALCLGPIAPSAAPEADVLTLARDDAEGVPGASAADVAWPGPRVDWARDDAPSRVLRGAVRRLTRLAALGGARRLAYDALARRRLAVGARVLSRGRVVVTDRLHAHLLSLLLGIPHVVLDNSYGKLSSFLDAWTGRLRLVHRVGGPGEARESIRRLLALPA